MVEEVVPHLSYFSRNISKPYPLSSQDDYKFNIKYISTSSHGPPHQILKILNNIFTSFMTYKVQSPSIRL